MAISMNDVAADVRALRSIAKAIRSLANALGEEEHIIKGIGRCGLCGAEVGLRFRAILTRQHGVKSVILQTIDSCCKNRTREHVEYAGLHPDHE